MTIRVHLRGQEHETDDHIGRSQDKPVIKNFQLCRKVLESKS